MSFMQTLRARWEEAESLVCVGLDPELAKFPLHFAGDPDAVFNFCRDIVDATAPYVCSFKPQIAHFAALGAEDALRRLIAHIHTAHPRIPVILDSKRCRCGYGEPLSRPRFGAAFPRSRRSWRRDPVPHFEPRRR